MTYRVSAKAVHQIHAWAAEREIDLVLSETIRDEPQGAVKLTSTQGTQSGKTALLYKEASFTYPEQEVRWARALIEFNSQLPNEVLIMVEGEPDLTYVSFGLPFGYS
jgi:hypothetical protein